jgi:O-acetyl-ADP-ribose deacetylase (regulator of RNase III)
MISYTDTTVFNVEAQTIVNTVNCVGVMSGGLALEFRLRYPEMFQDYVDRCNRQTVRVGRPYLYRDYGYPWILNFPTKKHWKYSSQLDWIEQGLDYFARNYQRVDISSIAFPQLGCSKGNLDWNDVKPLMENYLGHLKIPVYICLDIEEVATGIEGNMVSVLNKLTEEDLIIDIGLRPNVARAIVSALPLRRFRELDQIRGVGKQTYEIIFTRLYSNSLQTKQEKLDLFN